MCVCLLPGVASGHSSGSCRAEQLRLVASRYGEAGGSFIQTFVFTNAGGAPCRLAGWPSIALRTESGRAGRVRAIRVVQGAPKAPPFRPVTLEPGGAASFDLFGADWNVRLNRACSKTSGLFVVPPGARRIPVSVAIPDCGGFFVAPIVAGRTDRDAWSVVWHG